MSGKLVVARENECLKCYLLSCLLKRILHQQNLSFTIQKNSAELNLSKSVGDKQNHPFWG
jgi:hypothetical protein